MREEIALDYRAKYRVGLSDLYLPFYDGLCAELGTSWQPYCGVRTFTEQDRLWMQGRVLPGNVVTNAKGGDSPHNYACASDWAPFDGVAFHWPSLSDALWQEYASAVHKVGARWGGDWKDGPHNELAIKCAWSEVRPWYQMHGADEAQNFIKSQI